MTSSFLKSSSKAGFTTAEARAVSRFEFARSRHRRLSKTIDVLDIDGPRGSRGSSLDLLSGSDGLTCVSAKTQRNRICEPDHRKSWWHFPSSSEALETCSAFPRTVCSLRLFYSGRPGKDNSMSEDNQTVKHMASVKAAWDKAPEGPKKATALKHYQAAEKAHEAENDEEAHNELKLASRALV